jgi:integrase
LRHTYASQLALQGVPLFLIGKLLGHTQSSTTDRYLHAADKQLREATEKFPSVITEMEKDLSSGKVVSIKSAGQSGL